MRWNKTFDGTKDSLKDKSHRPLSKHPNAHTNDEILWIKSFIKRNPNISMIELYAKLKFKKDYMRHPCSLFRILRRIRDGKNHKKVTSLIFQNLMTPLKSLIKNGHSLF